MEIIQQPRDLLCVEALEEAIETYGFAILIRIKAQYTSQEFTNALKKIQYKISMDGKGRRVDNVMIERLWRTKNTNACIYKSLIVSKHLRSTIKDWVGFTIENALHSTLVDLHPMTCIIKG